MEMMAETFIIVGRVWIKLVTKKNKIVLSSAMIHILMLHFVLSLTPSWWWNDQLLLALPLLPPLHSSDCNFFK
jgi:hypothetical protein